MKRLVVTADDFGLSPEVNAAVEEAHTRGILTAASLMVAAPAAADAVARARRLPHLRVGLHLVLVDGKPALSPREIPDLVGPDGRFRTDMVQMAFDMALKTPVRRQIAAEITAQFELYRATGLPLGHVDAHKHFHLHPIIASLAIQTGLRHGMHRLRVPYEPSGVLERVEPGVRPFVSRVSSTLVSNISARYLRGRARRAGLEAPDAVFGVVWSGAMTAARVQGLLAHLPEGRTEIYTHPATRDDFVGAVPGYRYRDELEALIAPASIEAAQRNGAWVRHK